MNRIGLQSQSIWANRETYGGVPFYFLFYNVWPCLLGLDSTSESQKARKPFVERRKWPIYPYKILDAFLRKHLNFVEREKWPIYPNKIWQTFFFIYCSMFNYILLPIRWVVLFHFIVSGKKLLVCVLMTCLMKNELL